MQCPTSHRTPNDPQLLFVAHAQEMICGFSPKQLPDATSGSAPPVYFFTPRRKNQDWLQAGFDIAPIFSHLTQFLHPLLRPPVAYDKMSQTSTHPRQHTLRSVGETDGALVQSLRLRCGARRRWHGSL